MKMSISAFILLLGFHVQHACSSKSVQTDFIVEPSEALVNQIIRIECNYSLGDDSLYALKLFHEKLEFYRYVPQDNPTSKVFPLPHLQLTEAKNNIVHIRALNEKASGIYSCEVLTDAPSFLTITNQKRVTVVRPNEEKTTEKSADFTGAPTFSFAKLKATLEERADRKSLKLECLTDLDTEELYKIEIYKNHEKLFSYGPKLNPTITIYKVKGVNIEAISVSNTSLVLYPVTPETSGTYKCEMFVDAPTFKTIISEETIHV